MPSARRTAPSHAEAIAASLEIAAERGGDLTPIVYALLYTRQPQLHTLFWRDGDGAIKGEMLMKVIEAILDFIGERRYGDHLIQAEAMNHEGYDVPRDVFATFFRVVAAVVRQTCGAEWTAAMEEAWHHTLADLDVYVIGAEQVGGNAARLAVHE